jgi:hypothetical protein
MKYKELKNILVLSVAILLFMPALVRASGNKKEDGKKKLAKTQAGQQVKTAAMNINNLNAEQQNNGFSDYNPNSNLEGTEYPKGTGRNAMFATGFLWGGYVQGDTSGQVQVGGAAYRSGLQPGPILANGQAADNTDPRWQIYRVRPDVYPGGPEVDLTGDAASSSYWDPANPISADQVRAQYEHDWTYWPAHGNPNNSPDADLGAPFKDVNNDGLYEPDIDIPGVPGADQTIFYVANDMDPDATQYLYGTNPLGLELHVTMWAYNAQGALGNMYFKKFDLINKGFQHYTVDSMIVAWWADIDLGSASDDLVGNDSTLSFTYVYNGEPIDAVYSPLPPPCTGADFFQGPLLKGVAGQDLNKNGIDDSQDYAIFNGQKVGPGYINMPMTAAFTFTNPGSGTDATFNDPPQGNPLGSTQFYDFMKGENNVGAPYIDPTTNKTTPFIFSGDPVTRTGWIDGQNFPPRDVRSGMAAGPFTMAPGDTQEVVVAELVAGAVPGVDYLQAITLAKVYDKTAQNAYDNFFVLPKAPPAPKVVGTSQNKKVLLNWGSDLNSVAATEQTVYHDLIDSIDASGGGDYKFEGYNIYQLPYAGATIEQAKKLATFDLIDQVSAIPYTDPVTRTVEPSINIQTGTDSGIKRYYVDSVDVFSANKPLNNGTPYYFAVTAYSYNPKGVQQSLESPIALITVTPQSNPPGVTSSTLGDFSSSKVIHSGLSNASVNVKVVDPLLLTGHTYKVVFHPETYSLDSSGVWTDVTAVSKKLRKAADLTGSSITGAAGWSETKGLADLHYLVDVQSPNYDYCDGVKLQLPAGVIIDSVYVPISNNTGDPIPYILDRSTNTILFVADTSNPSLITADTLNRTGAGVFAGGEDIQIQVHSVSLPLVTHYTMYDDNWGDQYGGNYVIQAVDVSGIDTIKTVASQIVTQNQWDVVDSTTHTTALKNQTILGGQDIYAPQDYFAANGIFGPGGSTGSPTSNVGVGANVIFNGLQVSVDGSYDAPTTFQSLALNGNHLSINASSGIYQISDFSLSFTGFGAGAFAWNTITSYGGAGGTHSIDLLQQDYEMRWTGVRETTVTAGDTVVSTGSGGQLATLIGASNYSIANDPANPNPGSTSPFLFRIPFEVWNIDKNEQMNVLVWHRLGNITDNPFNEWNYFDRMYVWIVSTKYDPSAPISPTAQVVADSATWNWVFFQSDYKEGDVIKATYANPLQLGKDTFTFTTQKTDTSADLAKQNVSQINVFPNPYYGVNYLETTKYNRFVTFSHLPTKATIRIFNLAGFMVRSIDHNGGTFEQWDLNNSSGLPVGSGLYIAYIDMPDLGVNKILKFSIIQEQQVPDHF